MTPGDPELRDGDGQGRVVESRGLCLVADRVLRRYRHNDVARVLTLISLVFLAGRERAAYEAALAIATRYGIHLERSDWDDSRNVRPYRLRGRTRRDQHLKAVATLLGEAMHFEERVGNDYVAGLLTLLATLATDRSERRLFNILFPIVTEAARDVFVRNLYREAFPGVYPVVFASAEE